MTSNASAIRDQVTQRGYTVTAEVSRFRPTKLYRGKVVNPDGVVVYHSPNHKTEDDALDDAWREAIVMVLGA